MVGLEATDREVFLAERRPNGVDLVPQSAETRRPDAGLMPSALGDALFYAGACASACRAKKRIML